MYSSLVRLGRNETISFIYPKITHGTLRGFKLGGPKLRPSYRLSTVEVYVCLTVSEIEPEFGETPSINFLRNIFLDLMYSFTLTVSQRPLTGRRIS